MAAEHPWFKHYRASHDPLEQWLEVEREMFPKFERHVEEKPWGCELIWAHTSVYVGKVLMIDSNKRLSRQYHEKKEETFMVMWGDMTLEIGMPGTEGFERIEMLAGASYHCPPRTVHRMCAGPIGVHVNEVSTNDLYDVVRLEDDYGR